VARCLGTLFAEEFLLATLFAPRRRMSSPRFALWNLT
jgi:hypothetical protein